VSGQEKRVVILAENYRHSAEAARKLRIPRWFFVTSWNQLHGLTADTTRVVVYPTFWSRPDAQRIEELLAVYGLPESAWERVTT
jgi:hypothetical protein